MKRLAHQKGVLEALTRFGVKLSFDMEDFAETLKRQAVGDPVEAARQIGRGTFFSTKSPSLLKPHRGMFFSSMPRTPEAIGTQMSWPLMGSFLHYRNSPDASTEELMGDFTGRAVGSLLGSSLGAVGQIGGSLLLAPVGQAIGKAVSDSRSPVVSET